MRKNNKWVLLVVAFIIYLADAMDIAILTYALPAIREDFGLSAVQGGMLASATLLGMGFSSFIIGWLGDNYGRRKALIIALVAFILMTCAAYIVPSFTVFLIIRFICGLGLGGVWSLLAAFITETWPEKNRAMATAFVLSSFPIGFVVAAQMAKAFLPNWQNYFLTVGLLGIIPLLLAIFLVAESGVWLATREKAAAGKPAEAAPKVPISRIFQSDVRRSTILMSMVTIFAFIGYYGASTWLPSYLATERGMEQDQVSFYMTALNLGMFAGYIVFGALADKIGKKNALLLSLFGTGVLMPLYGIITDNTILLWLGPAYAFFMTFAGLLGSYLGELYPTSCRAMGSGFAFNTGRGVSAFAPMLLGGLAAATSWGMGLVVAGLFFLVAGVIMCFLPKYGPGSKTYASELPKSSDTAAKELAK